MFFLTHLSTFPVGGNRSAQRKLECLEKSTTFGRALTDSSHEFVMRIKPTEWKLANIVPVHKNGDTNYDVENYLPPPHNSERFGTLRSYKYS